MVVFPTPAKLKERIDGAIPFDRHRVMKDCAGTLIEWPVSFYNIGEGNRARVVFKDLDGWYLIFGYVDLNNSPEFKHMDAGTQLTIRGEIEAVDELTVHIKDISVVRKENLSSSAIPVVHINRVQQLHLGVGDNRISSPILPSSKGSREWYEKSYGILVLLVIGGLIVAYIAYILHWAP